MRMETMKVVNKKVLDFVVVGSFVVPSLLFFGTAAATLVATGLAAINAAITMYAYVAGDTATVVTLSQEEMDELEEMQEDENA